MNKFYPVHSGVFDIQIRALNTLRVYSIKQVGDTVVDADHNVQIGKITGQRIEIGPIGSKKADWMLIEAKTDGTFQMQEFAYAGGSAATYSRSEIQLLPAAPRKDPRTEWTPRIGDQVNFTVNAGQFKDRTLKVVEQRANSFLISHVLGWISREFLTWYTLDELRAGLITNLDEFCVKRRGSIEQVTVPVGVFRACHVRDEEDAGIETWFVANLPFVSFVRQVDSELFDYQLKSHPYLRPSSSQP